MHHKVPLDKPWDRGIAPIAAIPVPTGLQSRKLDKSVQFTSDEVTVPVSTNLTEAAEILKEVIKGKSTVEDEVTRNFDQRQNLKRLQEELQEKLRVKR